jgi:uncharacterized protein (TIGR03437 family)
VAFASLVPSTSATITLVATVGSSLIEGDVISNTATVDSATPDINPENNSATAAVKVRGVPLARLTLEGGKSPLEFGPIAATHEPLADPPARSFTVESIGSAPLVMTFASLSRMGPDVGGQKIANQDDRSLFQVRVVNSGGGEAPVVYNTPITIAPKSQQRFRVVFNPLLPILAGSNTMVSANQVLPESMTAQVTIAQNAGEAMTVNLLGHVSTVAKLIHPTDPRRAPFVKLDRTGGEITVECSVFDPNQDLSRVVYQFLSANDSKVGVPVEVEVADEIKNANLIKGQAFKVVQPFEGGSSISQIGKVQVTIYDRESNPSVADGPMTGVLGATEPALATVSAASYQVSTLPGDSIVAGFGAGLAAGTQVAAASPLPTELAGTRVRVRDGAGTERLAPLFFVSPGQVNYQIPADSSPGAATVTIVKANGAGASGVVHIADTGPGLFAANSNGQGVAAAVVLRIRPDGTQLYEPVSQFDEARRQFVSVPINLALGGDQVYLILFGTGIRHRASLGDVKVAIGGTAVPVLYAGEQGSFAGLDQVNVALPQSLSGRGEVDVMLGVTGRTANAVRVNIGGNAGLAALAPAPQKFSADLRLRLSDMEFRPAAVIVLPPIRLTALPVNKPE